MELSDLKRVFVGVAHISHGAGFVNLPDLNGHAAPAASSTDRAGVLKPGRNCWRLANAGRAAVLIDASNYYARLETALRKARRSILIVGWDFDGRIKLCPDDGECPPFGDFLRSLVEARPELEVRILVWSGAVVHASSDAKPLVLGAPWQDHPRVTLKLDQHHPLYASHHQKIVSIDGVVAFVGGIDLTIHRWDTCEHAEADPLRLGPNGASYRPIHDVQMLVDGEAASAIDELARERWRIATDEMLSAANGQAKIWPTGLEPDFMNGSVAIARTIPEWGQTAAVTEIAALTVDLLSAARQSIYIESQYFTASKVRRFLKKSLAAKHGPEIVILIKRSSPGMLERAVMGTNRERMMRDIRRADRHNRLRFFYPVVEGKDEACEVFVHAKLLIVDNELVRIGSSNLNNRSLGLDTECDLVLEASTEAHRGAIAQLRERLLAEHLGTTQQAISKAIADQGSLIRGIEACNQSGRGLRPFPETDIDGPIDPISGTALLDPAAPLSLL